MKQVVADSLNLQVSQIIAVMVYTSFFSKPILSIATERLAVQSKNV